MTRITYTDRLRREAKNHVIEAENITAAQEGSTSSGALVDMMRALTLSNVAIAKLLLVNAEEQPDVKYG